MANRALGLGNGLTPVTGGAQFGRVTHPSNKDLRQQTLFRQPQFKSDGPDNEPPTENGLEDLDTDYCLGQVRMVLDRMGKDAAELERWLIAAKSKCPPGQWSAKLKKAGIARSTAYYVLSRVVKALSEDEEDKPGKKAVHRDKEEPLDRAKRVIHEHIDQAEVFHEIREADGVALRRQADSLIGAVWELYKAPKRVAMKPLDRNCRRCGALITVAQSAKSGKPVAYEKGRGKYVFDNDGRMEYSKTGGEYFPHHVRCPGIKNRKAEPNSARRTT